MELLFKILLIIHIVAGSIGLITGTINIIRKKGDVLHKNVGKYFYYGMIVNGIAGMLMACIHNNLFLFIIGVFSIYMTITGQRYLFLKSKLVKPKTFDKIVSIMMLVFGIGFIIYGALLLSQTQYFGIVLLVFGGISIMMVKNDFNNYKNENLEQNTWILAHIQRMTGAYIAASTAFLVVNNTILPSLLAWLLPTIIFTPLIFKWSKKIKK